VDMIRHEAIRMQPPGKAVQNVGEKAVETFSVRIAEEDVLLMVPAQGDVVHRARNVDSQRPSHEAFRPWSARSSATTAPARIRISGAFAR
jgi:hypothetical protein